ncbi:PBP1A family penicillin-binding protein [Acuticoccus sediminis]|uniref:PBP1A family penicillin-binding protein n=1 Tax=Acuticoccus sediminis TaxID=2184697 RepID=UPI001390C9CE|nr:PBP1A family penicillin-binding protein [Acuticoccus sediminis]
MSGGRETSGTKQAFAALGSALWRDARRGGAALGKGASSAARSLNGTARSKAPVIASAVTRGTRTGLRYTRSLPALFRRKRDGKLRRWPFVTLASVAGVAVVLVTVFSGVTLWALRDLPLSQTLPAAEEPVLTLQTADKAPLFRRGGHREPYAELSTFPDHVVDAVLATEDRRFYSHGGVDPWGVMRAAWRNWRAGMVVEGGSTISQQLVKILYLDDETTLRRKIQEAVVARNLDRQLGKDRILELYLNTIYLGAGASGVPAAARVLFDTSHEELTIAQAAVIAGSIRAPSAANLRSAPDAARARAGVVVDLMAAQGRITDAEAETAKAEIASLVARPRYAPSGRWHGGWFTDWVLPQAEAVAQEIATDVTITVTLDEALQELAEEALQTALADHPGQEGAIVMMEPDGKVRALVGGRDPQSEFNRATQAKRQPGSTFKLFTYAAAISEGLTPDTMVNDVAIDVNGWRPQNFSGRFSGRVTAREAFARSLNGAAVNLAMDVGIDKVAETAEAFGIEAELTKVPALALGTSEVTLLDLTEAYAAVLAGRAPIQATGIAAIGLGDDGPSFEVAPTAAATDLSKVRPALLSLLESVTRQGTGRRANWGGPVAGKTGTSQDSRDAWFVGFSDKLVVGVWIGRDDFAPLEGNITGGSLPAEIFASVMKGAAGVDGPAESDEPATPIELVRSVGERGDVVSRRQEGAVQRPPPLNLLEARAAAAAAAAPRCNIRVCSRFYRSFRASDCTYQPYRGPRRLCTR